MNVIRKFIETHRPNGEPLVLCTLVRKSGSSYRGVGAKKIVTRDSVIGFLSGGCLEASIEKAARERITELPFIASFSTLAEEDRLLGYQTGCQGVIDILFEDANAGNLDLLMPFGESRKFNFVRVDLSDESLGKRLGVESAAAEDFALFEPWVEPVQLFVIGCGADADVFGPLSSAMGWQTKFIDYRGSLMTEGRFAPHQAQTAALHEIGSHVPNGARVAVVLMTHNYEADMEILVQLKNHRLGYLGCLGPAVRFERLQKDLLSMQNETLGADLLRAARAPAGIFTHGKSPEEIALSIVAQIQGELIEHPKDINWTLILAAGASSRFGSVKALAKVGGETFLERAIATAREVSGDHVFVVTGAHDLPVPSSVKSARNPDWQKGMGTSIAFGVRKILELSPKAGTISVLPVDQPHVSAAHIAALVRQARAAGRCALTTDGKILSPPVTLPKQFFSLGERLVGDQGLKAVLKPDQYVAVTDKEAIVDVDRPSDLPIS